MYKPLVTITILLTLFGCVKVPKVADRDPIYPLPTISLHEKARGLLADTLSNNFNNDGYLLYEAYTPLSEGDNYQKSHDMADAPAWHGHWMATLGYMMACEKKGYMQTGDPALQFNYLIHESILALRSNFHATGIDGLLARSVLKYDGDTYLPWMDTKEDRPTKFWMKGQNGYWFRNGPSKGHYDGAVFGLAVLIGLDNKGSIDLLRTTRSLLHQTLLDIAHYIIDNDYQIIDWDGKCSEFGYLNDWSYNGFDGLQLIAMLRAGMAIGDAKCASEYKKIAKSTAGFVIATTLEALGEVYARAGRQNVFGHFSDDQSIYTSAFAWWINASHWDYVWTGRVNHEEDEELLHDVKHGLRGIWDYLKYSRKSFITFIYEVISSPQAKEHEEALDTLRLFPPNKFIISPLETDDDSNEVQPICNQKINSHYWKTNYFRKVTLTPDSKTTNVIYSAQDYLFVYWMGRFYGLITDSEATTPVVWE